MSSFIEKYLKMPTYVIHIIIMLVIGVNLLSPLGLPMPVSDMSRNTYNMIESLPPGSVVAWVADISPGNFDDTYSQAAAIMNHVFSRDLKVLIVNFQNVGPATWARVRDKYVDIPSSKVYGVDYVELGYAAGDEAAVAAFCADIRSVYTTDAYGTPIDELELMDNINLGSDVDAVIGVSIGDAFLWTVRQWHITYDVPLISLAMEVSIPSVVADIQAGNINYALCGAKMGAEYEILIGKPGPGASLTDAKSLAAIILMGMVVLGNVFEYMDKKMKGGM